MQYASLVKKFCGALSVSLFSSCLLLLPVAVADNYFDSDSDFDSSAPLTASQVYGIAATSCVEYPLLQQQNFFTPPSNTWQSDFYLQNQYNYHCRGKAANNLLAAQQLQYLEFNFSYEQYLANQREHKQSGAAGQALTAQLINERQQYFNNAYRVLNIFLEKYPNLQSSIESAAGYGVFQATTFNALLYAGGWGSGVVFDKVMRNTIYVGTFRAGTGLGLGYIDEYVLIIFHKHFAIEQYFGNGIGGDVGASGTLGIWSKSLSFNPTISTYRIYNYGADVQGNWGGMVYWIIPSLN